MHQITWKKVPEKTFGVLVMQNEIAVTQND